MPPLTVRLPAGLIESMDDGLRDGETRTVFVRSAIEREVKRRR